MSEEVKIQIAHGDLSTKLKKDTIRPGELFWQKQNFEASVGGYPWSEGSLFIGKITADNEPATPIEIAGPRAVKSLVFRDKLYNSNSELSHFATARQGDLYVVGENLNSESSYFKDYDLRENDLLFIETAEQNEDGTTDLSTISFIFIRAPYTEASDLHAETLDGFNNIQEILTFLLLHSFNFKGEITSQQDVTTNKLNGLEQGSIYYISTDGIILDGIESLCKKGDIVQYIKINDTEGSWQKVYKGYSDASDIDVDNSNIKNVMKWMSQDSIDKAEKATNVQSMIEFLLQNKAELDANGKILPSQLPVTGMQLKGEWNPLMSRDGIDNADYQYSWPIAGEGFYYVVKLDYEGVTSDDTSIINVQYRDKASVDATGDFTRILELNDGDFILYAEGKWIKIDNTDRIASIGIEISGYKNGKDILRHEDIHLLVKRKTGNPIIASENKIGAYEDGDKIVISGVRLVDQALHDDGKGYFIPRYDDHTYNTLKNSNLEDYDYNGRKLLTVHTNFTIDDEYSAAFNNEIFFGPKTSIKIKNANGAITSILQSNGDYDNEVTLPKKDGTLFVDTQISSDHNVLPITDRKTGDQVLLKNSNIYQKENAVFDAIRSTSTAFVDTYEYQKLFEDNNAGDSVIISSNLLSRGVFSKEFIGIGTHGTNASFFIPGRSLFNKDEVYNRPKLAIDPATGERYWVDSPLDMKNVYVEMPATDGVLLTSSSRIHGGKYIDENDEQYIDNVAPYIISHDWNNSSNVNSNWAIGSGDLTDFYKPNQDVNKEADVEFNSIKTNLINGTFMNVKGDSIIFEFNDSVKFVDKNGNKKVVSIYATDAKHSDSARKLDDSLFLHKLDNIADVYDFNESEADEYNGSQEIRKAYYQPNQNISTNGRPSFKKVSVDDNLNVGTLTSTTDLFVNYDAVDPNKQMDLSFLRKGRKSSDYKHDENGNIIVNENGQYELSIETKYSQNIKADILGKWFASKDSDGKYIPANARSLRVTIL